MKIKTVISWLLAVFIIGVIASIDWRQGRSEEQRLRGMETRLDSAYRIIDSMGFRADKVSAAVRNLIDVQHADVQDRIYDTLDAIKAKHVAKHATMRFVLADSSVVLGTWADMQDRVWDIREATPIK